jgi:hypothetical protein
MPGISRDIYDAEREKSVHSLFKYPLCTHAHDRYTHTTKIMRRLTCWEMMVVVCMDADSWVLASYV